MQKRSNRLLSIIPLLFFTRILCAEGVSPYLPLNLAPDMERQIARLLVLAGKPVMRRPIPAATVLDALPQACAIDVVLCIQVRRYLQPYMSTWGITTFSPGLAVTSGSSKQAMPSAHGEAIENAWDFKAYGYYQPSDFLLVTAGGVAYSGNATPTGTLISAGFDWAQLDIGYRDHWYSPSADGSFLIGTQAPTLPSITLSNYRPLTRLGGSYEIFLAKMPKSDQIAYPGGTTTGHPNLLGIQVGIEPVPGYALGLNRLMQYGGGARGQSGLSGLRNAFFRNDVAQSPDTPGQANEFGNQLASITSSFIYPGKVPFEFHFEYAGEDNLYSAGYRLGKVILALGVDFPKLGDRYDLSYDVSERQDSWYVNHLYGDGLTNDGHVLGHWFGDDRIFGDSPGGYTQSLSIGRRSDRGAYWHMRYHNSVNWQFAAYPYRHAHSLALSYANSFFGRSGEAQLNVGRDVFGKSFVKLAGTVDLARPYVKSFPDDTSTDSAPGSEIFLDIGSQQSRLHKIYWDGLPDVKNAGRWGYHAGFGVRRPVTEHGDLGARVEVDEVDSHQLISFRALDYRYRVGQQFGLSAFFGAARYQIQLPAWGYYWGVGAQYRQVLPHWDAGIDFRHHEKISRNNLLPTDRGYGISTVSFRDIDGFSLYMSYRL